MVAGLPSQAFAKSRGCATLSPHGCHTDPNKHINSGKASFPGGLKVQKCWTPACIQVSAQNTGVLSHSEDVRFHSDKPKPHSGDILIQAWARHTVGTLSVLVNSSLNRFQVTDPTLTIMETKSLQAEAATREVLP